MRIAAPALITLAASATILGCAEKNHGVPGYDGLAAQVEGHRVGGDSDSWIEMKNLAGEWERVGLIFGFLGDYDECLKAIAGMKKVNYAREYRCVPAN